MKTLIKMLVATVTATLAFSALAQTNTAGGQYPGTGKQSCAPYRFPTPGSEQPCPGGGQSVTWTSQTCPTDGGQGVVSISQRDACQIPTNLTPEQLRCAASPMECQPEMTVPGCKPGFHWTLAGTHIAHCAQDDPACGCDTVLTHDFGGNPSCSPVSCGLHEHITCHACGADPATCFPGSSFAACVPPAVGPGITTTSTCIDAYTPGATLTSGSCTTPPCNPPNKLIAGVCTACNAPNYWVGNTCVTHPTCPANEIDTYDTCCSTAGYSVIGPAGIGNGGVCCPNGDTVSAGACVPPPSSCAANTVFVSNPACPINTTGILTETKTYYGAGPLAYCGTLISDVTTGTCSDLCGPNTTTVLNPACPANTTGPLTETLTYYGTGGLPYCGTLISDITTGTCTPICGSVQTTESTSCQIGDTPGSAATGLIYGQKTRQISTDCNGVVTYPNGPGYDTSQCSLCPPSGWPYDTHLGYWQCSCNAPNYADASESCCVGSGWGVPGTNSCCAWAGYGDAWDGYHCLTPPSCNVHDSYGNDCCQTSGYGLYGTPTLCCPDGQTNDGNGNCVGTGGCTGPTTGSGNCSTKNGSWTGTYSITTQCDGSSSDNSGSACSCANGGSMPNCPATACIPNGTTHDGSQISSTACGSGYAGGPVVVTQTLDSCNNVIGSRTNGTCTTTGSSCNAPDKLINGVCTSCNTPNFWNGNICKAPDLVCPDFSAPVTDPFYGTQCCVVWNYYVGDSTCSSDGVTVQHANFKEDTTCNTGTSMTSSWTPACPGCTSLPGHLDISCPTGYSGSHYKDWTEDSCTHQISNMTEVNTCSGSTCSAPNVQCDNGCFGPGTVCCCGVGMADTNVCLSCNICAGGSTLCGGNCMNNGDQCCSGVITAGSNTCCPDGSIHPGGYNCGGGGCSSEQDSPECCQSLGALNLGGAVGWFPGETPQCQVYGGGGSGD